MSIKIIEVEPIGDYEGEMPGIKGEKAFELGQAHSDATFTTLFREDHPELRHSLEVIYSGEGEEAELLAELKSEYDEYFKNDGSEDSDDEDTGGYDEGHSRARDLLDLIGGDYE